MQRELSARPAPAGLATRALSFSREERVVLDGFDAEFPAGQLTAVLGASGSGKSTLLRLCNGLLAADAGSVVLDGVDTREIDPPSLRRRVGLVSQRPVMLPGTVGDNIIHGATGADVEAALAAAGLDSSFGDRDASRLSGGEQARVAIARALVRDPRVLLLDEATAPLDRETARRVGATLRERCRDGIAVVLATHDVALADELADRAIELEAAA